jgi:hypothetical protein
VREGFEPELETGFLGLRSDRKRINDSEDEPKNEKFRSNTGQIAQEYAAAVQEKDLCHCQRFCASNSGKGRGRVLFGGLNSCYKPSVFQPSKMFGFDFETFLTDMTINGNLQLACLA